MRYDAVDECRNDDSASKKRDVVESNIEMQILSSSQEVESEGKERK